MCPRPKILGCCIPWTKCPLGILPLTEPSHPFDLILCVGRACIRRRGANPINLVRGVGEAGQTPHWSIRRRRPTKATIAADGASSMLDAVQGRDTSVRDTMSKGRFVPGAQHPRIFGRGHIGRGHINPASTMGSAVSHRSWQEGGRGGGVAVYSMARGGCFGPWRKLHLFKLPNEFWHIKLWHFWGKWEHDKKIKRKGDFIENFAENAT